MDLSSPVKNTGFEAVYQNIFMIYYIKHNQNLAFFKIIYDWYIYNDIVVYLVNIIILYVLMIYYGIFMTNQPLSGLCLHFSIEHLIS